MKEEKSIEELSVGQLGEKIRRACHGAARELYGLRKEVLERARNAVESSRKAR